MRVMAATYRTRDGAINLSVVGSLLLVVNHHAWSDETWLEYLELMDRLISEHGAPVQCLNFSPSFAPTSTQVTRLVERFHDEMAMLKRVALVTGSSHVRKTINVIAWLIPAKTEIHAYQEERMGRALDWIVEGTSVDVGEVRHAWAALLNDSSFDARQLMG
jgi:hypothetical protein